MERIYTVRCIWDPEAEVWVATSDEVPGLATGADTLDGLVDRLKIVIPELLEVNGMISNTDPGDIPSTSSPSGTSAPRAPPDGRELHAVVEKLLRKAGRGKAYAQHLTACRQRQEGASPVACPLGVGAALKGTMESKPPPEWPREANCDKNDD